MNWLNQIRNWKEVARITMVMAPITTGVWIGLDRKYDRKLEENTEDVALDARLDGFESKLDGVIYRQDSLLAGQDGLDERFFEFKKEEFEKFSGLQNQIQQNHKAFMFSLEHQGEMNRDALIDAVEAISEAEKKKSRIISNP